MACQNNSCKWNKSGKCILFVGQTMLECKYREIKMKPKFTKNINKKGK